MAYEQQTWVLGSAGGTPLNAVRLNHMEAGIAGAHSLIVNLAAVDHTHVSADITDATSSNAINTIVKRDGTGFIAVTGITGLSTATGSTQAVPKSQLDAGLAGKASSSHTHTYTAADVGAVEAVTTGLKARVMTQAAYDALGTKDATTLYIIQG